VFKARVLFGAVLILGLFSSISAAEAQSSARPEGLVCLEDFSKQTLEAHLGVTDEEKERGEVDRYGVSVTPQRAALLDQTAELRHAVDFDKLRESAVEAFGLDLVAVTWSPDRGVQFRVTDQDRGSARAQPIATAFGLGDRFEVVEVPNAMSEADRKEVHKTLRNSKVLESLEELGVTWIETDELCGRIIFYTDKQNEGDVSRFLARAVGLAEGIEVKQRGPDQVGDLAAGRGVYTPSQSAGLEYDTSAVVGGCTSNVPWYRSTPSGLQFFAVTAAHCVDQATWATSPSQWNGIWWTTTTTSHINLSQGGVTIASANATIRFGAGLDVAIWPVNGNASTFLARTLTNTSSYNPAFHNFGWWQWSPTWYTGTSGGDAIGDLVCQSGITQALRTPNSGQSILTCSALANRNLQWAAAGPTGSPLGADQSWFYNLRKTGQVHQNVCEGDSGGAVWRGGWLSGVVHGGAIDSTSIQGRACWRELIYSHVGYIKQEANFNLTAPATFS